MEAIEAILSRRSVRRYTDQPVSDEIIKELLRAAMSAPSAGNEQPWHFIVINEHKILIEIPKHQPYSNMLKDAPLAILVCGDEKLDHGDGYWVQDCSAATENLLIAINAKGLGGVWLGVYPIEKRVIAIRKLLNIPEHIIPFSLIALGYQIQKLPTVDRYKSERIHYNKWK